MRVIEGKMCKICYTILDFFSDANDLCSYIHNKRTDRFKSRCANKTKHKNMFRHTGFGTVLNLR